MSLVIELESDGRKAGRVCSPEYRRGASCPLIVRQTSEDVLTAEVFGILRRITPSLWLRPMMERAFNRHHVDGPTGRVDVRFWAPLPPPSVRSHIEGNSEIDVLVQFDETVLLVESKYRAPLSPRTKHDESRDQLARLLDVAYQTAVAEQMFPREPFVLVLGVAREEPSLVTTYRDPSRVAAALAHYRHDHDYRSMAELLAQHVGYLCWADLARILVERAPHGNDTEHAFMLDVGAFIRRRVALVADDERARQRSLPMVAP